METREQTMPASSRQHTGTQHGEAIQQQAAKLPSDAFLYAAGGSIVASLTLKLIGRDRDALFVGQWAPTFIAHGLLSKMTRLFGSDTR